MTKERKILTGIITAVGIVISMAGWAAVEGVILWHDSTYVTIASQNKALRFEIEDEIAMINERIQAGTATQSDIRRKAVLEDRLRNLS
jgi:hypothetical protein